jgi:integrase
MPHLERQQLLGRPKSLIGDEPAALRPAARLRLASDPSRHLDPELAEQMGHSPQMTVSTYTHVIRELKGQPTMAAEDQIEEARRDAGGRLVDVDAV